MQINKGRIYPNRENHFWYGGAVSELVKNDYLFVIEANGIVSAELKDKNNNIISSVNDKNMSGEFYKTFNNIIKDDIELEILINNDHPEYILDIFNNNWWECIVIDPDGNQHDLEWCLDSYKLTDAIDEVIKKADNMIQYIKENI